MERSDLARLLGATSAPRAIPEQPTFVEAREPAGFMAQFATAVGNGGDVFLLDPDWGGREREQLNQLVASTLPIQRHRSHGAGWLMIPSGGSAGKLRFARHDEATIATAVHGFCAHFGLTRVNAVGILPLHHVSGLMAWMRCVYTGGAYRPWSWKQLEAGSWPEIDPRDDWVISLVPTQLQRLLAIPAAVEKLRRFKVIFLGGGPSWPELTTSARAAGLPISLSYGMTETAAMITALRPAEFLAGQTHSGMALPHGRIEILDEADGRVAPLGHPGVIRIASESLFRGYYPHLSLERVFVTQDLGGMDLSEHLSVLGRQDAVIITGGKKVSPTEVEEALRTAGVFSDLAVIGLPDGDWGESVTVCYPGETSPDLAQAEAALVALAAYKRPKRFVPITPWPRNAQGKVNRAALAVLAAKSAEDRRS